MRPSKISKIVNPDEGRDHLVFSAERRGEPTADGDYHQRLDGRPKPLGRRYSRAPSDVIEFGLNCFGTASEEAEAGARVRFEKPAAGSIDVETPVERIRHTARRWAHFSESERRDSSYRIAPFASVWPGNAGAPGANLEFRRDRVLRLWPKCGHLLRQAAEPVLDQGKAARQNLAILLESMQQACRSGELVE